MGIATEPLDDEIYELKRKLKDANARVGKYQKTLRLIASCAGAPDPVEALRNVVWVAEDALGEWEGTFSLHEAKAEGSASRLANKIEYGKNRRNRKRQKRARSAQIGMDITQQYVATACRVSIRTVERWESGKHHAPKGYPGRASLEIFIAWCKRFRNLRKLNKT